MNHIASIVTRLPPVVDGIGDYALSLAHALRDEGEIETSFIIGDPTWSGPESVEGFPVVKLAARSASALLKLLPSRQRATVLLHYGGYGYATRGCPMWLVEALGRWREAGGGRTLLTMFHELYACGPLWSSSFWLSPLQRQLAARLARMSDGCMTSLEAYADKLNNMSAGRHTHTASLPVFSSVGDPTALLLPLMRRRRRLVVFGTRGRRAEVYRRSTEDLRRVCRVLEIEEVADIGSPLAGDMIPDLDVPVVAHGMLSGACVSAVLADSVAGVIDYPAHMLGKSTIFAAYCAHRVLPLVAAHGPAATADGLQVGRDYLLLGDTAAAAYAETRQGIADHAYEWYQTHTVSAHAQALRTYLAGRVGKFERELSDV